MNLSRQRLWKAKARVAYWQRVRAYFGSRIVAAYPLTQDANDKSGNNLHGTAANVTFDSSLGALFNGTSSKINIYSAALLAAFNSQELTFSLFYTPTAASWTDGSGRRIFGLRVDGSNFVEARKDSSNNSYSVVYTAGGTIKGFTHGSQSFTTPTHLCLTVSKSYDEACSFRSGIQLDIPLFGLGAWSGSIASNSAVIGALNTTPIQVTAGYVRDLILFNGEITESEVMMLASPTFIDPQPPSFTNLNPTARRFVWISDVHRGNLYASGATPWSAIIRHINAINPEFVIDTGDICSGVGPSASHFLDYKNGTKNCQATIYNVVGNHDAAASGGYLTDMTLYNAAGFSHHSTVDIGNFRIISFETYTDTSGTPSMAWLTADEKTWLLGQLDAGVLGGKTPILAAHFQGDFIAAATGGWSTFWADVAALGVKGMLSGHDHFPCLSAVKTGGIVQVMGPSVWGQGASEYPGVCVVYVFDDHLSIEYKSARYPFSDFTPSTTPAYTTITINR